MNSNIFRLETSDKKTQRRLLKKEDYHRLSDYHSESNGNEDCQSICQSANFKTSLAFLKLCISLFVANLSGLSWVYSCPEGPAGHKQSVRA